MTDKKRKVSEVWTEAIEEIAREHAAEIGFDMEKEPHALMRMIALVLSRKELRDLSIERLKQKLTPQEKEDGR